MTGIEVIDMSVAADLVGRGSSSIVAYPNTRPVWISNRNTGG